LATVREDVVVGSFTIVGRGVAIENGTKVGSKCKIETNAYITALSNVEDEVSLRRALPHPTITQRAETPIVWLK